MAGLVNRVFHTDGTGIPLRATMSRDIYKTYWLDCGLMNRMQGLTWESWSIHADLSYEGILAEQFVAQELLCSEISADPSPLFYWLREGKKGNAEVDFLVQRGLLVAPVEVKSGSTGSMKSLAQFVRKTNCKICIKLSKQPPSLQNVTFKIRNESEGESEVECKIIEIPLYLSGRILA